MNQRRRPAVTDPVILMFSRRQVVTCDIHGPLELLRSLTAVLKATGLRLAIQPLHHT